jgi:hypothetical protein
VWRNIQILINIKTVSSFYTLGGPHPGPSVFCVNNLTGANAGLECPLNCARARNAWSVRKNWLVTNPPRASHKWVALMVILHFIITRERSAPSLAVCAARCVQEQGSPPLLTPHPFCTHPNFGRIDGVVAHTVLRLPPEFCH